MAAPVASTSAVERLRRVADEVVALLVDPGFEAVGQYYDEFSQTNDEEVIALLHAAAAAPGINRLTGFLIIRMPELPEVEVLARHLRPLLRGKTIRGISVRRAKGAGADFATGIPTGFAGRKIHRVVATRKVSADFNSKAEPPANR